MPTPLSRRRNGRIRAIRSPRGRRRTVDHDDRTAHVGVRSRRPGHGDVAAVRERQLRRRARCPDRAPLAGPATWACRVATRSTPPRSRADLGFRVAAFLVDRLLPRTSPRPPAVIPYCSRLRASAWTRVGGCDSRSARLQRRLPRSPLAAAGCLSRCPTCAARSRRSRSCPAWMAGLARLRADLASGAWNDKYSELLDKTELDLGHRLIVAGV